MTDRDMGAYPPERRRDGWFCAVCGKEFDWPLDDRYCSWCGTRADWDAAVHDAEAVAC